MRAPQIDRRRFLRYVGAGAAAIFTPSLPATPTRRDPAAPSDGAWVRPDGTADWVPPRYPLPLPGDDAPADADAARLARYEVRDDLVLPEGFEYRVVARWGDVYGPRGKEIRFGYDNDYTGLLPVPGARDEHWLFVNHEYVAIRPWLEAFRERYGEPPPALTLAADERARHRFRRGFFSIDGWTMPGGNRVDLGDREAWKAIPRRVRRTIRDLSEKILSEVGVSVLRVRRLDDGTIRVIEDAPDHRRISAFERHNVDGRRHDAIRLTGPAARLVPAPPGTLANCSGGTTPWGTFLTCEENIFYETHEDVAPDGEREGAGKRYFGARGDKINGRYVFDNPVPSDVGGNGHVLDRPLDGRGYGWVGEVDPATGRMRKHTALGRFRHENVALRCEPGKRLAAYMGDDRRGGHVWKYVSDGVVEDPADPATAALLERGTLYVARFRPDFTGRWIALETATPLRAPEPEHCFSGYVQVPARPEGGTVEAGDGDDAEVTVEEWRTQIERFAGKPFARCTLGDLVRPPEGTDPKAILLLDAFAMANACGGTPVARPEDLEIHPLDRSVYVAFTDATDGSDGAPDGRIFPDSDRENSRQYGAIYRILEGGVESADADPAATTFTWGRFVASGEVAEHGGGFACADNMVFDPQGNLWIMTDVSTTVLNFPTARDQGDGSHAGGKTFPGVFGNNALFMIPTVGPNAGVPELFALAPMESELCGPTFTDDGRTLILSVQHPGERWGTRRRARPSEIQEHVIHDRKDRPFVQKRTVPIGSNFPHGELDRAPRPCVVCITRSS